MRGDYPETPFIEKIFDNRARDRASFFRVRPRADFVDKTKRRTIDVFGYFDYVSYMRTERGKVLLDALFVADVAEYIIEIRYFRSFRGGNEKTAHRHKRKQPRKF